MSRPARSVIEYRIYDLPPDLPILCLTGEHWRISDIRSGRLHFHNCLEIGFCHTDSGSLEIGSEPVAFRAGDITFIPRHVPHTTYSDAGKRSLWSYLYIDLEQMSISGEKKREGDRHERTAIGDLLLLHEGEQPRIRFLARCLLEECREARPDSERMIRIYAQALGGEILRSGAKRTVTGRESRDFTLLPVLEYIHNHYAESCGIADLAEVCHLSQTHFRRLFLSIMGTSPLRFINETRVRHACAALDTTDDPVTVIAQRVGMPSTSSFNRNFQQIMGVTPSEYRASSGAHLTVNRRKYILPYRGWTQAEERPGFEGERCEEEKQPAEV